MDLISLLISMSYSLILKMILLEAVAMEMYIWENGWAHKWPLKDLERDI